MVSERGGPKSQQTQTRQRHEHTQNSRQEERLENEVPNQEAIDSEECHADVVGLSIQFEKHQRQGPQLFHLKYAQVRAASQDDQGGDLKEAGESQNGASHEAEERREQREAPVHGLK